MNTSRAKIINKSQQQELSLAHIFKLSTSQLHTISTQQLVKRMFAKRTPIRYSSLRAHIVAHVLLSREREHYYKPKNILKRANTKRI